MQPIVITVDIDAPPNDVWAILRDVERWPTWTPTVQDVTRLDPGPFVVGSRTRVRQPRMRPAVWRVTRLEEGRRFTWVSRSPGLTMEGDHAVEPRDTGCRATLSLRLSGLLAGIVGRMFGALAQRYVATEAESLRRRCEGARTGGTGTGAHV